MQDTGIWLLPSTRASLGYPRCWLAGMHQGELNYL